MLHTFDQQAVFGTGYYQEQVTTERFLQSPEVMDEKVWAKTRAVMPNSAECVEFLVYNI